MSGEESKLAQAREEFVTQWGALGSQWGINRTMAQIHALLMTAPVPLSTDDVMDQLGVSRGNAHTNLKELVAWGLVRSVMKKGERREFFEAEKDVWQIFTTVTRERKRREIEPAVIPPRPIPASTTASITANAKGNETTYSRRNRNQITSSARRIRPVPKLTKSKRHGGR